MITVAHVAAGFAAYAAKMKHTNACSEELYRGFTKMVPWIVLPDGIRNFIGARQAGHHEVSVNGGVSWMEYPVAGILKNMTKETAKDLVQVHVMDNISKLPNGKDCAIGEYTDFDVFNEHNIAHPNYHELAMHLCQDAVLDHMLRDDMVDVADRYNDIYVIRHNSEQINGDKLREQIFLFEKLAFLYFAGQVYKATGTVLNKRWYEDVVYTALKAAYPEAMAESAYGYMVKVLDELDERICALNFGPTDEEREAIVITDKVDAMFNKLYIDVYWASFRQL